MTTNRRFESISGILTRTTPNTGTDPAPDPAGQPSGSVNTAAEPAPAHVTTLRPAAGPGTSPGGRRRTADPAPRPQPKSAAADGGVRRIAFRLDPDLYTALNNRAARDGTSHGQVVLDSIEAAHSAGVLADLIDRHTQPATHDGLFPRLKARRPTRPTVLVEIRLHTRATAVLDTLVDQTNADSRTQLIVTALRHNLS